ncbi:response regulator transcription factor [Sphingomonas morindae]|uniref:Response regulator transcription factor n=1 Tax=Sphingomonas morindae TaxID=1541170 RepID=A0ABY4XAC4_9SPHN|nr:response regulator transcription factor [Sphingomonas morindae]USI73774.1 response regulator transcription factor [Sphingomonas morindae]
MSGGVLVVDDEFPIRRLLRNSLERAGYAVLEAADGAAALAAVEHHDPAAVLLDLGLPDRDGLSLVPILRKRPRLALLIVSARDATGEKVAALDLGADDYVTKPFDSDEVLARLRAALRHRGHETARAARLRAGAIEIDLEHRLIRRPDGEAHLTRKEHDVLAALAAAPGRVVTHQRILEAAWPLDHDRKIEYLRIVIRNLRQKIEPADAVGSVIVNELGIGYRLRAEP